jgi:hypothetical protein
LISLGLNINNIRKRGTPAPPPQYGFIGVKTDLPSNDFSHAGGNIVSCWFECLQDAQFFQMNVKVRSTAAGNRMRSGIYTGGVGDSLTDLVMSPDIIDFGTTIETLNLSIDKSCLNGEGYTLAYQAEAEWFFFYTGDAATPYALIAAAQPFGSFPASPSPTYFNAVCQFSADYVY